MADKLDIVITLDKIKLMSVNDLYKAGLVYKGGKAVPHIYKNPQAKKFESILKEQLRAINFKPHIPWIASAKYFTLTCQFIFKVGINKRDCDNVVKLCQDSVFRFLKDDLGISHLDDAQVVNLHLHKGIIPKGEHEYFCFRLEPFNGEVRFDKISKPEEVYIHIPNEDTSVKDWMKQRNLKYQWEDSKRTLKDWNTDIFRYQDPGIKDAMSILEYVYEHLDSRFIYIGTNSPEIIEKIKELGRSNIDAGPFDKWKEFIDENIKKV